MEAAEQAWRPLGELLLSKNLIAKAELDVALGEQEETGKLLGAILVDRGFISGPALAIALAEQYGVELDQQQGFGTGLWAEIERRHRSERGINDPEELQVEATVVKFELPQTSLEAVPDPEPEPDPQLERLEEENRRLQEEIARLHTEFTQLRVIEPEPDPELERLEEENRRLQGEVEGLNAEIAQLQVPDPQLDALGTENGRLHGEIERLQAEIAQVSPVEPEPELPSEHLLFVPTARRYLLVERQGPPPDTGAEVALSEGSFVVGKVGRSPLRGESRVCAFLLASA